MRAPTASELLLVWERCRAQTPAERALELLTLATEGDSAEDLRRLTVGRRDGALLDIHELLVGSKLDGEGECGKCGEAVEFSIHTNELRLRDSEPRSPARLAVDAYELSFRLLTTGDLAEVSREPDAAAARSRLIERCVLDVRRDGKEVEPATLPQAVVEALGERMAQADPQGDLVLALSCPACGHEWRAALDAAAFLWGELDAWSRRTLYDVHVLAAAYGWGEQEILALGPRRNVYLELVGAWQTT
jgi:hypothetical protein